MGWQTEHKENGKEGADAKTHATPNPLLLQPYAAWLPYLAVMSHLLPAVPLWRFWHLRPLADVDNHVLGVHTPLQLAHLGVLAAALEEAGRLNLEVANGNSVDEGKNGRRRGGRG